MNALRWILSLILAGLFLYMAQFKFMPEITGEMTGAANPVFPTIAKNTGIALIEPYLRWITGVMEIVTAVLLIIPRTRIAGAGLALCVLAGALISHLTPILGIEVEGAGKVVFFMAIGMTVLAILVLLTSRGANAVKEHA